MPLFFGGRKIYRVEIAISSDWLDDVAYTKYGLTALHHFLLPLFLSVKLGSVLGTRRPRSSPRLSLHACQAIGWLPRPDLPFFGAGIGFVPIGWSLPVQKQNKKMQDHKNILSIPYETKQITNKATTAPKKE